MDPRPLELVLSRLGVPRQQNGMYKCPTHDDSNPSLALNTTVDGTVLMHCHASCKIEAILDRLGLEMRDLFARKVSGDVPEPNLAASNDGTCVTVASLAAAKRLPKELLRELGVADDPKGNGVLINYFDYEGNSDLEKRRTALRAGKGSYWPKGKPLMPYGRERLDFARDRGLLIIVEGESDRWTLEFHGYPSIGIPGANATSCLERKDVEGIPSIIAFQEPDKGGIAFIEGISKRLRTLGWAGKFRVMRLDGFKDPNDLHKHAPTEFRSIFDAAIEASEVRSLNQRSTIVEAPARTSAQPTPKPWPKLDPAALHGLAGDFVRLVDPSTEADPVAILAQTLVAFGNAVGSNPHFRVEDDRHSANLFAVIVASTAARKGTSWGRVAKLLDQVEPEWSKLRIATGLSSGEGVIHRLRDAITQIEDGSETVVQQGVDDKRLLVYESEFASTLRILARDGNILSPILRNAWDSRPLEILTKNSAEKASNPHLSIVAHITPEELLRYLDRTEVANGFGNRFLWVLSRRLKSLPRGGAIATEKLDPIVDRAMAALEFARSAGTIQRDADADTLWCERYESLRHEEPGLVGKLLARGQPQVLRLSLIYALLDRANEIRRCHLESALALWSYCAESVRHVFGDTLGDPTADEILRALRVNSGGQSRTELVRVFSGHKRKGEVDRALAALLEQGLVSVEEIKTNGRPEERWFAKEASKSLQ